jgi:hypothetical protein
MDKKTEIRDYLKELIKAAEREDAFSEIWDTFWMGVAKLKGLPNFTPQSYYDPDGSDKDDIMAWWSAHESYLYQPESDIARLRRIKPWD